MFKASQSLRGQKKPLPEIKKSRCSHQHKNMLNSLVKLQYCSLKCLFQYYSVIIRASL